jgi:hypothetical protein
VRRGIAFHKEFPPSQVKKNAAGKHRWTVEEDVEVLVRELARMMPDQSIAAVHNRTGKLTGRQNGWMQGKVCGLRKRPGAAVHREGERAERGGLAGPASGQRAYAAYRKRLLQIADVVRNRFNLRLRQAMRNRLHNS